MFTSARIQARTLAVLFALLVLLGAHVPPAHAAGVIVNCTPSVIQSAISNGGEWHFNCGTDTIPFAENQMLTIPAGATVILDGDNAITIDGQYLTRLIWVAEGAALTLREITITHGWSGTDNDGGAIVNYGSLTLDHATLTENSSDTSGSGGALISFGTLSILNSALTFNNAGNGGAIYAKWPGSHVAIQNSTLSDNNTTNTVNGWGGAILAFDGATVTISRTQLLRNEGILGGAIYNMQASTTIIEGSSVVKDNSALVGGGVWNGGTMTVDASTLDGNQATNVGGGAFNYGDNPPVNPVLYRATLNLQNGSRVIRNHAGGAGGGGITNEGILNLDSTEVMTNTTRGGGGGLMASGDSDAYLTNATIAGNTSDLLGGGIEAGVDAYVQGTDITIRDNRAVSFGGGIFTGGVTTMKRSTLSGNASAKGGGMYSGGGTNEWENVTLSGNKSSGNGGGLYDANDDFTRLANITFYANSAVQGGAIFVESGDIELTNTILAGSLNSNNCTGAVVSKGGNLSSDTSCTLAAASDQQNANPRLGPLADNGGATRTHLPGAGSPAIDAARGTECPLVDQRGVARPQGSFCDVGSVEVGPDVTPPTLLLYLPLIRG